MKVQFLKDTSKAIIPELKGTTLVIYRDGYRMPIIEGAEYIDFEKYKIGYTNYHPDNIIMVGTNRIFVPAIRCELVFEYLQTMTAHINKISIDTAPFIGEPWRLWFHYSLAYGTWLGYNYSYVVETDWQHWFYRESDDSVISAANIAGKLQEVHSDLPTLATEFEFYTPDAMLLQYYNEVKQFAFNKYATPKQIIQLMLKELNKHLSIDFGFGSYLKNKKFLLPDFGIFHFVAEENQRRMDIYNTVISNEATNI